MISELPPNIANIYQMKAHEEYIMSRGSYLMKRLRFTRKNRGRHGMNNDPLSNCEDSSGEMVMVLYVIESSFQNSWFHWEIWLDSGRIMQKGLRGGETLKACVSSTARRL